jgi:sugar-specific transcriptional regulator TrmB
VKYKELIERFKESGFKEYEAKIFLALLSGNSLSATEIAREAKLIRTSIYDTLKSFVERGYCNEIETGSILKYQIIDPEVIIGKIEKEFNESNARRVSSIKDTFKEASAVIGYGKNSGQLNEESIELIRGFNKHRVIKYTNLVKRAKKEILGMNRIRGIFTDELKNSADTLIKSGGVVRYIYKVSLDFKIRKDGKLIQAENEDLVRLCESFEMTGEQVRLTETEIPNLAIFDGLTAYINISNNAPHAKNRQSDLIIRNADFVNNLKDMFEYYWKSSMKIAEFKKYKNVS